MLNQLHQGIRHWCLADETLVMRDADPCAQKARDSVISCLGHLVRIRAICFEQSHRLTTVDDNIKTELDECLSFFQSRWRSSEAFCCMTSSRCMSYVRLRLLHATQVIRFQSISGISTFLKLEFLLVCELKTQKLLIFIGNNVMQLQKLELWFRLITHLLWAVSPVDLRMLLLFFALRPFNFTWIWTYVS